MNIEYMISSNFDTQTKPPLGIKPEKLWKQARIFELIRCIARYTEAYAGIPDEWLVELGKHLTELYPDNKTKKEL